MLLHFDQSEPLAEGTYHGVIRSISLPQNGSKFLELGISLPDRANSIYIGRLPLRLYDGHPLIILWRELFPTSSPCDIDTDSLVETAICFTLETIFVGNRSFLNLTSMHLSKPLKPLENNEYIPDDGAIDF